MDLTVSQVPGTFHVDNQDSSQNNFAARDSGSSSLTPEFFIQDFTVHFDGGKCDKLTLFPANLEYTGRKVTREYSKAGLDEKCNAIEKCKAKANVDNTFLPMPPIWRPSKAKTKKEFKKGKELAFWTTFKYANFIAQFTPRPGVISVAQDIDGNTMFALSVRKDERKHFDTIKTDKQKEVLERVPGDRGAGHGYCSEQVITHNILVFRQLQMKRMDMPEFFEIDKKIEISVFCMHNLGNEQHLKCDDQELGNSAFSRKFMKQCSGLKYRKGVPACPSCRFTNEHFGFIDKHARVDEERSEAQFARLL